MVNGAIPDSTTYLTPAYNFLAKGSFLDATGRPEIARTPGYPAFLAAIMLGAGSDLRTILITQAIILSFSVVILYWLARRILPPAMAFTGALLAAFSPWGAVLAGLPLADGLFLFLLCLIFLAMKLTDATYFPWLALGGASTGIITGAAVLVRPFWPLVILVPGALFYCYGIKRKGAWILLIATITCATAPVVLWKERNQREAHFNGLSDIPGKTVWRYLASRVKAQIDGGRQDRFTIENAAILDDRSWGLSVQEADNERWRRAKALFREHPFLTVSSFAGSAAEHIIHPSPDVLTPAKLNFYGDYLSLALLWAGLLTFTCVGWRCVPDPDWDDGEINRRWLLTLLMICMVLVLSSGISFGTGSRLRAPMEAIVPLLAAVGLVRSIRVFSCIFSAYKARKNAAFVAQVNRN